MSNHVHTLTPRARLRHTVIAYLTAASALFVVVALGSGCDTSSCHEGDCHVDDAGLGTDAPSLSPSEDHCRCLLLTCHEPFHAKYGEADADALAACVTETDALAASGTGDTLACRHTACEAAMSDATQCDAALGNAAPCM